LNRTIYDYSNI
jgi:hypothetical protein